MKVPRNLNEFITELEKKNQLIRISEEISPKFIITEINDRLVKRRGPALLFENITGSKFPLLINAYGSFKRLAIATGVGEINEIYNQISELIETPLPKKWWQINKLIKLFTYAKNTLPKKVKYAPCQERIMQGDEVDLTQLPILTCWTEDAGPFITLPQVITQDPLTGKRNIGLYRMQVLDKNTTGMHWQIHKVGAKHYQKYKKANMKKIPVSVAIGGTPVITYAATAPLPDDMDEIMLAGVLAKRRIQMVKCITNDLYVPAESDFILEGYIDIDDLIMEGPFGDHTGYYSLADKYPRFHIQCISHKQDAVYLTTVVGRPPMEDYYLANMTERLFLPMIRKIYPEIIDMKLPVTGAFHNLCLLKIESQYPQHPKKIMSALWGTGQIMFTKCFLVFDEKVNLNDYHTIIKRLVFALGDKSKRIVIEGPVDSLDHSSPQINYGSKIGFDLTEDINENLTPASEKMNFIPTKLIKEVHYSKWGGLFISLKEDIPKPHLAINKFLVDNELLPRFVVIIDNYLKIDDDFEIFFRLCANMDPQRDILFPAPNEPQVTICDATSKNKNDDFYREWPKDLSLDKEIYQKVDSIMEKYPSLSPYKKRIKGCHFIDKDGHYKVDTE